VRALMRTLGDRLMARRSASIWQVTLFASVLMSVAFVAFGSFTQGFSLRTVSWLAFAGAILGAVAAPTLEPKAFRHPILWQNAFCILGLESIAFYLRADPAWHGAAMAGGILLGSTARFWVDHISPP
jgi:hypothetical protein